MAVLTSDAASMLFVAVLGVRTFCTAGITESNLCLQK